VAAPLLALASAVAWGTGDFCGGLGARRSPLLGVLLVNLSTGVLVIAAAALLAGEPAPGPGALGWAAAAGLFGTVGLGALYLSLAVGRMAVVAPVSAVLAAALPAAWSALTEGTPSAVKLAGIALALGSIWLVSGAGSSSGSSSADRRSLLLALASGGGIGLFLVLMHEAGKGGAFWPLTAARTTSVLVVAAATALRRRPWLPAPAALPLLLLSGLLDAAGNTLFVLAGRAGRLDVAAVLSSMYPAATLLLAALLLRERVTRAQGVGIAAMLAAIALIAG